MRMDAFGSILWKMLQQSIIEDAILCWAQAKIPLVYASWLHYAIGTDTICHVFVIFSHLFARIHLPPFNPPSFLTPLPSVPVVFRPQRFFHRPADGSEVMYDPVSVMNADILNYCQKESWCKLGFYLLSFFYYLYRCVSHLKRGFQPEMVFATEL